MPDWMDRPRSRIAAGVVGAAVLAVCVVTPLALAKTKSTHGNGATWSSTAPARSIATTVYVAAIDCRAVKRGAYRGQQSGVELFGRFKIAGRAVHPDDFAGVYSYCHGKTAHYRAQFVVANTDSGEISFRPAGIRVKPGDPLKLSIKTSGGREVLSIINVNTKKHADTSGPALDHGYGWAAGTMPIDADDKGAPQLTGSERLGNEYALSLTPLAVKGPVPTAPIVFEHTTVDGHPVSHTARDTYASNWTGIGGKVLVSVSTASGGNFNASLKRVKKPRLAKTAELTRVGGEVTIKLPGTNRFIHAKNISDIPDGTVIDARHGSVQITLALPHGKSQTGVFYSGEFRLTQGLGGKTTAALAGGSYRGCPSNSAVRPQGSEPKASTARAKHVKLKTKKTKVRGLWSNAHGDFTTKGSYGAAAVLGTRWYTEDRCDGTYFYVARDQIEVTSYYPTLHKVLVKTGHSYLARAVYETPSGTVNHSRLGHITLLEGRADAQAAYPFGTSKGFTLKYYFKLAQGGVRIGFASPELMATLPPDVQNKVRNRVVWASTWSSYYAIDGIRIHASLANLQHALPGGELITVGSNDWYLAPFGRNTAVFKVDNDAVSELGIALASVTTSRGADRTLMSSFDS